MASAMPSSLPPLKDITHKIDLTPRDVWKTSFKTIEGLFKWLVILFGQSNAPSTFMRLANEIFLDFIGKFVVFYLDEILIFRSNGEKHLNHVEKVLRRLHDHKLIINLEKCTFMQRELTFLGFFISQGTLKMDPSKVEEIINWPPPKNQGFVKIFHGLATFYRKFIKNFSNICAPMFDTLKGG